MDQHTLKVLEYDAVRKLLLPYAACQLGMEKIEQLEPLSDFSEVQRLQRETSEARQILEKEGNIPFGGVHDVRVSVKHAAVEGLLNEEQLYAIAETLGGSRRLKAFLTRLANVAPYLADYVSIIGDFQKTEDRIFQCINDEGNVADSASPQLAQIRTQIRTTHGRMVDRLNQILRTQKNLIQEPIITLRGDRYCIPVKSESRAQFGGLVHDQSASGATLFMEPASVVELGNEIRQLNIKEHQEIERILTELAGLVGKQDTEIQASLNVLAHLDFTTAKARLALEMNAIEPQLNGGGLLDVHGARHPLLTGNVIPIDFRLGGSFNTLVITGPNTGGKTVTLKTIGLFVLMAMSGLQVPCQEGSILSTFEQVFADIGDEQSIAQSLSTFSSHIRQIIKIVSAVNPQTLILLDEVGAGTDPTEGAALARSILETFAQSGAKTIATTHYGELKEFAYSHQSVENASVEFDLATLRPTYRLLIGIPGSSNALTIASRLGLPENLVKRAEGFLSRDHVELSDVIRKLEQDSKVAKDEREGAERTMRELREVKKRYEDELASLRASRAHILEDAEARSRSVIRQAQDQANDIISHLRRQQREGKETEKARKDLRALSDLVHEAQEDKHPIHTKATELEKKVKEVAPEPSFDDIPPKSGDDVMVVSLNQRGQLLSGSKGEQAQVAIGSLKIRVPYDGLKRLKPLRTSRTEEVDTSSMTFSKKTEVSTELQLLGKRAEEAITELEKYLDDAYLAGISSVRIVHGKGTGILRKVVWEQLKHMATVKSWRPGDPEEGSWGVTIVEFKE